MANRPYNYGNDYYYYDDGDELLSAPPTTVVYQQNTTAQKQQSSAIGGLLSPVASLLRSAQKKTSPNLEQFEKLSNDFIKDAKAIFGSRITDNDLKAFMATIPTLGQTDEGKLAIINNMKMFNKASRIRAEAVKDIIRENGNRRPHNLQILVEDRIKPQLDQLSKDFSVV